MSWGGRLVRRKRDLVVSTYGTRCWLCGREALLGVHHLHPLALTVDHRLPRSRGGTDELDNLAPAHRRCNLSRGDRVGPAPGAPPAVRPGRAAEDGAGFFR